MERVLNIFALSGQRIDARADALLVDAFPATAVELLPEWELTLGLPDPCVGTLSSITERQMQVVSRLVSSGGQSINYFKAVAASIGVVIESVTEYKTFTAGMRVGQPIYGEDWAFHWRVNVQGPVTNPVQCLLQRYAPAQTTLDFISVS